MRIAKTLQGFHAPHQSDKHREPFQCMCWKAMTMVVAGKMVHVDRRRFACRAVPRRLADADGLHADVGPHRRGGTTDTRDYRAVTPMACTGHFAHGYRDSLNSLDVQRATTTRSTPSHFSEQLDRFGPWDLVGLQEVTLDDKQNDEEAVRELTPGGHILATTRRERGRWTVGILLHRRCPKQPRNGTHRLSGWRR